MGELLKRAAEGDEKAQYTLAMMYLCGCEDGPRSIYLGLKWLERACAGNHGPACTLFVTSRHLP